MTGRRTDKRSRALYTLIIFVLLASLDNTAGALYPALAKTIAVDLQVSEEWIGGATALLVLVVAVTAVGWGFWGDRSNRKNLLFWGTLIWVAALIMVGNSTSIAAFLWWTALLGIGLGSIASVGFSIVADLIAPFRRGLAMSFWGLSQGTGGFAGLLLGGLLGAENWRIPFWAVAGMGLVTAVVYRLTTDNITRGASEPEIAQALAAGGVYDYRIEVKDLRKILTTRTNIWLIMQGLTAQIAYGSLIWVPLLYQGKVIEQGYDLSTAVTVGSIFGAIFLLGAVTSILAGHIGDRWHRRYPQARALVAMVGILGAIPFFIAFFHVPLTGLDIPTDQGTWAVVGATLTSVVTNPWVALAFVLSFLALTLTSADSPNWFAMVAEVNLPEHRGTLYGLGNLSNGVSRALGTWMTVLAAGFLETRWGNQMGYALGLTLFQVFFIPTGLCYWRAAKTCRPDSNRVRSILARRARQAIPPEPPE